MSVVVAGHVCLDVIPEVPSRHLTFAPGRLVEIGAATFACGGGVANVGQALLRLGVQARLMGKVGDDVFGEVVRTRLAGVDRAAAGGLRVAPGESTSYTLVLDPGGGEHMFLHHPGCNDTFGADDVDPAEVERADVFYFGYPPLMRRIFEDGGAAFASLLERVRAGGAVTVLDMAMPDPGGASGRVDWRAFLARSLPHVDVFLPSAAELALMLGHPTPTGGVSDVVRTLALESLGMGAGAVGIKLGGDGLYLRTGRHGERATIRRSERWPVGADPSEPAAWTARELWSPVFAARVVGTTGAGDATVAGFIHALLEGASPERTLQWAAAVGGASVEAVDSVSGIPSADSLRRRLDDGWARAPHAPPAGWHDVDHGVYGGPDDVRDDDVAGAGRGHRGDGSPEPSDRPAGS